MWNYWVEFKRKATGVVQGSEAGCPNAISLPYRGGAMREGFTSLALEILPLK